MHLGSRQKIGARDVISWTLRPTDIQKIMHDEFAGTSVTEWIGTERHGFVLRWHIEQAFDARDDTSRVGGDQASYAGVNGLHALAGISHDEHGLAKRRCLLLNSTGIGKDEIRARHQVDELGIVQGLDQEDIGRIA